MTRAFSLRRRIIQSFLAMMALACLVFGFFSFLFAYSVEDSLFEDALRGEVAHQQAYWRVHRTFDRPGRDYIAIHADPSGFPPDLRRHYGREPGRSEFAGDAGRHYHVMRFDLPGSAGPAYAVAEVSRHLVVRPIRPEMLTFLALWALGMLLATGLIGYWLANRATEPLTRLAGQISDASSDRVPGIVAAQFPANEIGVLAQALERAFDRIRAFVEREGRFTRDASHELRTPLAVIKSAAELMATHRDLPPAIVDPLRRIAYAGEEMERTIDLLLELAREESVQSRPEQVTLLPLIETAVLDASERFGGGDRNVVIAVPETATVHASPTGVALILANLICNAFQHASLGQLSIAMTGDALSVADSGPGIAPDMAEAVAEPFVKGADSAGHGLGLSIVKRLCDRDGIAFAVEVTPGGGTLVRLGFRTVVA
jgi:signal transduction histidine kinase